MAKASRRRGNNTVDDFGTLPRTPEELVRRFTSRSRFQATVDQDLPDAGLLIGDKVYCEVGDYSRGDLILYPSPENDATIRAGRLCRINRKTLTVTSPWGRKRIPHPPVIARVTKIVRAGTSLEHYGTPPPIQDFSHGYPN
jgi:hypothetical protein